ncbi:unnamed protein product [Leptidea sinapis]|uniref:RFX-type winged-helix domain-containing protein n=1 Tax=Leptidea sinapis TaxID=189913 RepID=A0A5E4QCI2_9NEOP|nr:unnamed protein product [Leptidea sinapis]
MDNTTPFQPWAVNDSSKNVETERELVGDAKLHRENVNHSKHRQTASYDKESAVAESNIPGASSSTHSDSLPLSQEESKMDSAKIASMQQIVENTLRAELQQTVTWIQTHLEVDPDVSLPKQDVYDEYIAHCMSSNMKPLSTADFGKVMKQVYPTEPSSTSRETERIICDWAETKLVPTEETSGAHLMKQLKRKLQGTPGRPKKNKAQMMVESPPSTSYVSQHSSVKHEEVLGTEGYSYQPPYVPLYDVRAPFPYPPPAPHPALPLHEYRPDPYAFEQPYAPRDLTLPPDTTHNLPINLSSDAGASLDLSTERTEWQRRRPPDPHTPRFPLPGKKLILETYQSETRAGSPRSSHTETYLPKKMRAAEILGGKSAAPRQTVIAPDPSSSIGGVESCPTRSEIAFLEDPKNLPSRSKSTAAALARGEQEAASPTQSVKAPTPKCDRVPFKGCSRAKNTDTADRSEVTATPEQCCDIDGFNIKTGMICEEKHSEILNRERVISICNIDKHDLDDYLNENNSQEHEEELLQYFHPKDDRGAPTNVNATANKNDNFLERSRDAHDEHSQGKSEKISQLRELLAKNLKNQCGTTTQNVSSNQETQVSIQNPEEVNKQLNSSEGAFKPVPNQDINVNESNIVNQNNVNGEKHCNSTPHENGISAVYNTDITQNALLNSVGSNLYNGNCINEPQSPTTRTQQYDFVPISEGCHSPGNFNSKSPLGFGHRVNSPSKTNKPSIMTGSLQTSPVSHSTAASPFVSPRNTPVPRSRLCSRPIPKHNGNRKRRNPLTLGVGEACANNNRQFAIPTDQKFISKTSMSCNASIKYSQPMSAPPSPNILSHYKYQSQMSVVPNGVNNICLFTANSFRENMNGETPHPLSADPLSSEVSRFFQEPIVNYRHGHDNSFRSQSVPLKQAINNVGLLSYNNTPVGSVPPTPVPNEFCDFGSLADCDISKAGLNPETLDKIYDAIDSSNEVLSTATSTSLLNTSESLTNGCDTLADQQILTEEQMSTFIPTSGNILDRTQFPDTFANNSGPSENVHEFLKRTNSVEFDIPGLESEKNKYYTSSRSVPSTPLPYKRVGPNLQIDSRRSRELFSAEAFVNLSNGISSKSVPSTPQLVEERSAFSYSNRDFLINGNSVELCSTAQLRTVVDNDQGLTSPLDVLREDILEPLTPATDLLSDLDKIDTAPYVDL